MIYIILLGGNILLSLVIIYIMQQMSNICIRCGEKAKWKIKVWDKKKKLNEFYLCEKCG